MIHNKLKKVLIVLLTIISIINSSFVCVFADDSDDKDDEETFASYVISQQYTIEELLKQMRYISYPSPHGFAAEEGNNIIDKISGLKATVVGYDNVKNGADRIIEFRDGTTIFIQDKYYSTAKGSIEACFDKNTGQFKYFDGNGNPMQIEVPSDQYDEAIEVLKNKILEGKVPGISDPKLAETIIRKGHLTYTQAVNLTKAGTIESLVYDSTTGCVVALVAFGISTAFDCTIRLFNGEDVSTALKDSAVLGIKTGAKAFAIHVISQQLLKTGAPKVFEPAAKSIVKTFGNEFANLIIKSAGQNAGKQAVTNTAVKILQNQALVASVTIVVIMTPDVIRLLNGRISPAQLAKNFGQAIGGLSGAALGTFIGGLVSSGVLVIPAKIAGGIIGGVAGSAVAKWLLDHFLEDDADAMMQIVQTAFSNLCFDYLINEKEAEIIADKLQEMLTGKVIMDMYASENRLLFATELLTPLFEERIKERPHISMPSSEDMRYELINLYGDAIAIH